MARKDLFRVGDVCCYLRGRVWYMRYHENGRRRQVRAGKDRDAVRRLASEINTQLEFGNAATTSFEPISITDLRDRWLEHHEHVLRSSVATIKRYRTATRHLIGFIENGAAPKRASNFSSVHAEQFVHYLRKLKVSPNGHANAKRRTLRDAGLKYILEVCRSLFNFAVKRRHLPPYGDNPFSLIDIDRIPVEDAKPFIDIPPEVQQSLLRACDAWAYPIFATLMLTGLRPGELTHLLLPDNLDLNEGWLHVRNKLDLGWQVKTRNERSIPLPPELVAVLRRQVGKRDTGPVFVRPACLKQPAVLSGHTRAALQSELHRRVEETPIEDGVSERDHRDRQARFLWRDMGAIKPEKIREAFMRLTAQVGLPGVTTPKTLRHLFATTLQDANVDPLIRNQLMGHTAGGAPSSRGGLGMTSVYTHTRPETLRRQLIDALADHPAMEVLRERSGLLKTG
jgi:integrase